MTPVVLFQDGFEAVDLGGEARETARDSPVVDKKDRPNSEIRAHEEVQVFQERPPRKLSVISRQLNVVHSLLPASIKPSRAAGNRRQVKAR